MGVWTAPIIESRLADGPCRRTEEGSVGRLGIGHVPSALRGSIAGYPVTRDLRKVLLNHVCDNYIKIL